MNDPIVERRRTPRANVSVERQARFGVSAPVQILEISLSGVLLGSKTELSIGERAVFVASVGERSLRIAIEIRNVSIETRTRGGLRYRLGATFVGMTVEQRVLLAELLGAEPN